MSQTKQCSKCKKIKIVQDFSLRKISRDGYNGICKKCRNLNTYQWRRNNPEKYKETKKREDRKYYEKNKIEISKKYREKYYSNIEYYRKIGRIRSKKWRKNNPDKSYVSTQGWKKNNPEKWKSIKKKADKKYAQSRGGSEIRRINNRKWAKNNREKCNIKHRRWYQKYKNDKKLKISNTVRSRINKKLKARLLNKNNKRTFDFLPYTINELMQHLEKQFQPGMTWDNYGLYGWHIDHIIPDSSFSYTSVGDKEFQKCWSLKNLQPLWAKDNLRKSDIILINKQYESKRKF